MRSTCDDHRALVEQRGQTLRLEVVAGPVWIDGDPTRIAQVVSNLLHNASKFTPAGGTLSIAIEVKNQRAVLHVWDDGVGMEQAEVEAVFEPFMQGEQDSARQKGGLGLGLALVKGLVGASRGLGVGAERRRQLRVGVHGRTAARANRS